MVSLVIYTFIITALFYTQKSCFKTKGQIKKNETVAIKVIHQIPPKKQIQQEPKRVEPKKEEKVLQVVQKEQIKPKMSQKKKTVKPQKEKKIVVEKKVIPQKKEEVAKTLHVKTPKPLAVITSQKNYEKEKNAYFELLHKKIEENRNYPKLAQKRNIEDKVRVSFVISPQGELLSYEILHGKKIFHNSALEAIKKSFPLKPKKEIFHTNLTINMDIIYQLI
jgi:TonB family protein